MPVPAAEPPVDPSSSPTTASRPGAPAVEPAAADPASETRSDDDRDVGWGDDLDRADHRERDARWYEDQRPPHWG